MMNNSYVTEKISTTVYDDNTVVIGDISAVDVTDINLTGISITHNSTDLFIDKRLNVRNNGILPIDIWAKMYNNDNIGNIDDQFYF